MLQSKKNKKLFKVALFFILATIAIFLLPNFTQAAQLDTGLSFMQKIGLGNQDIRVIIANIIRILLGFLGILAVILIIYGGWMWMSSQGNEEKISKAKQILTNAVIGLIIILAAFGIATFILNKLIGATSPGGGPGNQPGSGTGMSVLGNGIIESHYPARGQREVPRNTKIVITFKEPLDVATIISGSNINANNIKIYKTADGADGPYIIDVRATATADGRTFVFKPNIYLGSPTEKIWYSVGLTKNIRKASGDAAFGALMATIAYDWTFEVGTFFDTTPPKVQSIIPQPAATEPRNVVIQINFNEAIDPTSASGQTSGGFRNIVINNITDSLPVAGNFYISNQYRTVEFLTENSCGVNSCGNTIFCLPGDKNLSALAKAATLVTLGEPAAIFPYDGVVDMADNSLDGNKNGTAQGPQSQSSLTPYNENNPSSTAGDDYTWSFSTNNNIDITAPKIINIYPAINSSGIKLDIVPEANFNKFLMSSSLTSLSITLKSNPLRPVNYWINKSDNYLSKETAISLNHDQFNENTSYAPEYNSGIKDIYQNCFSPCSGMGITGSPSCCNGVPNAGNRCP